MADPKKYNFSAFEKPKSKYDFSAFGEEVGVVEPPEEKPDESIRADGTKKGTGYFGVLKTKGGYDATEMSIGVEMDGKETEIPTLVPTLSEEEKSYLLDTPIDKHSTADKNMYNKIVQKAVDHARERIKSGKSPFADTDQYSAGKANIVSTPDQEFRTEGSVQPAIDVQEKKNERAAVNAGLLDEIKPIPEEVIIADQESTQFQYQDRFDTEAYLNDKDLKEQEQKKLQIEQNAKDLGMTPEQMKVITDMNDMFRPAEPKEKKESYLMGGLAQFNEGLADLSRTAHRGLTLFADAAGLEWKNPFFKDMADALSKVGAEGEYKTPDDIAGNIISGMAYMAPDLMATVVMPEMKIAQMGRLTKGAITKIPKFPVLLGTKEALASYEQAGESPDKYKNLYKDFAHGYQEGLLFEAFGLTAGEVGKLTQSLGAPRVVSETVSGVASGSLFGGHTIAAEYLETGSFDPQNAWTQFGIGLAFHGKKIGTEAMNAAKVNQSLARKSHAAFWTSNRDFVQSSFATNKSQYQLRRESLRLWDQAMKTENLAERNQLLLAKNGIDNLIATKAYALTVAQNPKEAKRKISERNLPEEEKQNMLKRIDETVEDYKRFAEAAKEGREVAPEITKMEVPEEKPTEIRKDGLTAPLGDNLNDLKLKVKTVADYFNRDATGEKSFDSLNNNERKEMESLVLRLGDNSEVLDAVISLVPVDVMNDMVGWDRSASKFFYDKTMLRDALSSDSNKLVVSKFLRSIMDATSGTVIRELDLGRIPKDLSSAPVAIDFYLSAHDKRISDKYSTSSSKKEIKTPRTEDFAKNKEATADQKKPTKPKSEQKSVFDQAKERGYEAESLKEYERLKGEYDALYKEMGGEEMKYENQALRNAEYEKVKAYDKALEEARKFLEEGKKEKTQKPEEYGKSDASRRAEEKMQDSDVYAQDRKKEQKVNEPVAKETGKTDEAAAAAVEKTVKKEKEVKDAEKTTPPVTETGKEKGPDGKTEGRLRVRDAEKGGKGKGKVVNIPEETKKASDSVADRLKIKDDNARNKIAEGFSDLATALGAKKEVAGEERVKAEEAVRKIAEGMVEMAGVKLSQLREVIKDYLKSMNLSAPEDLIDKAVREYKKGRRTEASIKEGKLFLKQIEGEVTEKAIDQKFKEKQKLMDEDIAVIDQLLKKEEQEGIDVDYAHNRGTLKRYRLKLKKDGTYSIYDVQGKATARKDIREPILKKFKEERKKEVAERKKKLISDLEEKYLDELQDEINEYKKQRAEKAPEPVKETSAMGPSKKTVPSEGKKLTLRLPSYGMKVTVDEMQMLKHNLTMQARGALAGKKELQAVKGALVDLANELLTKKQINPPRAKVKQLLRKVKKATEKNIEQVTQETSDLIEQIYVGQEMDAVELRIKKALDTKTIRTDKGVKKGQAVPFWGKAYLDKAKNIYKQAKLFEKQAKLTMSDFTQGLKGEQLKEAKKEFEEKQAKLYDEKNSEYLELIDNELKKAQQRKLNDNPIVQEEAAYEEIALWDMKNAFRGDLEAKWELADNIERTLSDAREGLRETIEKELANANEIRDMSRAATENQYTGKTKRQIQKEAASDSWRRFKSFYTSKKKVAKDIFVRPVTSSLEFNLKSIESLRHIAQTGPIYRRFFTGENGWMERTRERKQRIRSIKKEISDKIKGVTEIKNLGWQLAKWSGVENKTGIYLLDAEGKRIKTEEKMSKAQAAYVYALSRMEGVPERLLEQGWDATSMKQLEGFIGKDIKSIVDWFGSELMPRLHKDYNKTHVDVNRAALDYVENYVPLLYDALTGNVHESQIKVGESTFVLPSVVPTNIKARVKNLNELSTTANYFEVMLNYIDSMEKFHNYGRWTKDINVMLADKQVRKNIENKDPQMYSQLIDSINRSIENDTTRIRGVENAVHRLNRATAFAKIALRTWTAAKQILSLPAWLEYADKVNVKIGDKNIYVPLAGTAKFTAEMLAQMNPISAYRNLKFFIKESPFFEDRIKKGDIGDEEIGRGFVSIEKVGAARTQYVFQKGTESIGKAGIFMNRLVDAYTIASGGKALYNQNFRKYKKIMGEKEAHKQAIRDFELAYNLTQQSSERAFLGEAQGRKGLVKSMFATFKNAQFSYFRKFMEGRMDAMNNYTREREKWEKIYSQTNSPESAKLKARAKALRTLKDPTTRQAFKKMAIYGYVLPVAWQYALSGLPGMLTQWDDDDTDEMKRALVFGPMDGAFMIGDIAKAFYDKIVFNKPFIEYQPSQLITTINDAVLDVSEAFHDAGEFSIDVAAEIARQIVITKGVDIENLDLIYEGAEELILNGEWTQENIMKLLAAPKSLREGKKGTKSGTYIEFQDIKEPDIPDLDINIPDIMDIEIE